MLFHLCVLLVAGSVPGPFNGPVNGPLNGPLNGPAVAPAPATAELAGPPSALARPFVQGQKDRDRALSKDEFDRILRDDEALAEGQQAVDALLAANGGLVRVGELDDKALPLFSILPGLRYDLLEIKRTETVEGTDVWSVDNYLPRMIHAAPNGDAYAYSEYTLMDAQDNTELAVSFRRDIMTSDTAWAETDGLLNSRGDSRVAASARSVVTRELIFGMMPHGLALGRSKLAKVRVDETTRGPVGVYALRLDQPIDLLDAELANDFLLYVDLEAWSVLGATYTGFGLQRPRIVSYDIVQDIDVALGEEAQEAVRQVYATRRTAELTNRGEDFDPADVQAEADSLVFPEAFRIPYRRVVSERRARFEVEHRTADVVFDAFPEAAVARPWLTSRVWQPPYHADHWDPPVEEAAEEFGQE